MAVHILMSCCCCCWLISSALLPATHYCVATSAAHLWVYSQTNKLLLPLLLATQQRRLCCQQVNGALQLLEVVKIHRNISRQRKPAPDVAGTVEQVSYQHCTMLEKPQAMQSCMLGSGNHQSDKHTNRQHKPLL
jgi:hypothetical protein